MLGRHTIIFVALQDLISFAYASVSGHNIQWSLQVLRSYLQQISIENVIF